MTIIILGINFTEVQTEVKGRHILQAGRERLNLKDTKIVISYL